MKQKMTVKQRQWTKKLANFYDRLQVKFGIKPDRGNLYRLAESMLGKHCIYCLENLTQENISIDHAIPTSRKGTNALFNISFICKKCNTRKGNLTQDEYGKLIDFLNKYPEMKKIVLMRIGAGGFIFGKKH